MLKFGNLWPEPFPYRSARQSFAVLRGAVLGLQDGGDSKDAAEAGSEPTEEPLGEKQLTEDQTDNGQEFQSPWKQVQRKHLHLMVGLLRPQDDIRLVGAGWSGCLLRSDAVRLGGTQAVGGRITQTPGTLPLQPEAS